MPNVDFRPDRAERAEDAYERILDRKSTITVIRGSVSLTPQIVRVELPTRGRELIGANGQPSTVAAVVYGVKSHPDPDVFDTDLIERDRFVHQSRLYEVISINTPSGELQAYCSVVAG